MPGSMSERCRRTGLTIIDWTTLTLLLVLTTKCLSGQNAPPVTLHMYELLAQTTVLVAGHDDKPHPPLTAREFQVSIDSGHPIHPGHVRLEGAEPIDLSLLIDLSQPIVKLDPTIDDAIARVLPMELPPESRVSIYFLDCHLTRTLDAASAETPILKRAVASGLAAARAQQAIRAALPNGSVPAELCANPASLWDCLAFIARTTSNRSGHRVILTLTTGISRPGELTWNEVRRIAAGYSVAIFGLPEQLVDPHNTAARGLLGDQIGRYTDHGSTRPLDLPVYSVRINATTEDAFSLLCGLTGGIRFSYKQALLPASTFLPYFMTLVRGRYVIDFHPPSDLGKGLHQLEVKVVHSHDMALATGLRLSVSALQRADAPPKSEHSADAGKRKILSPNEQNTTDHPDH